MRTINKQNKKTGLGNLLILAILALGLIVGVTLVQQPQLFEKKAEQDVYKAFQVTDPGGNPLLCSQDTCQTNSTEIKIKVRDLDLLLEE